MPRMRWTSPPAIGAAAMVAGLAAGAAAVAALGASWWWLLAVPALVVPAVLAVMLRRADRATALAEQRCEDTAAQLDRRISELFSLQELSFILSESLQLSRVVDQVARYAARFLQAEGALIVLADPATSTLKVVAAEGALESLRGTETRDDDPTLIRTAIDRGRIEVSQGGAARPVTLYAGTRVGSAAVVPLRSHGERIGALAVTGRRGGQFTTEDLWLLSTVAMNASVVLANSRLFGMVERSKQEWETAFNSLAEGIAVVGTGGTVLRANSSLARMAGIPEAQLIGQQFSAALFGRSEAVDAVLDAARGGERPAPLVTRSAAIERVLRLTAAPLGGTDDKAIVALLEDVTDQQAMEAQLIHNEKMAAVGQLVSGVAHELNNPLTSIAGLTELLLERGPLPDFPREHLRVIHDQAERAGRIVRNLLTFARKGTPEKALVDLNDVVSRTSLLIAYEMKLRGIELVSRLSPAPLTVMGDRYELQQVLLNLVTNAVQAVGDLPDAQPRVISVETQRAGEQAQLVVSDTGAGVPADLVPYLFTPFFTTKEPGKGTGLGLSLSYGLVESHGGRLSYAQGAGGGAQFTIALPYVSGETADDSRAPVRAAPRRILVVDDDPAVHRLVSALFAPDGHAVDTARGGPQAMTLLESRSYDLVLADASAMAGPDQSFVRAVLAAHPEWEGRVAVAVSNGRGDAGGVGRRISKPFNLRELRALAEEVMTAEGRQ